MVLKRMIHMNKLYLASSLYILSSFILGACLMNGLVLFLGWNMILATLVYVLAQLIVYFDKRHAPVVLLWIIFGFWLLFFPNTFYIITDFIHLEMYDFFIDYPSLYAMIINDWFVMAHITIGALIGIKFGVSSIHLMEYHFTPKFNLKPYAFVLLTVLFILSSLGIYIGRFLRFNSWDFYKVFQILNEMKENGPFLLIFVLLFTIIHWLSYFLFSYRTKDIV